MNIAKKKVKIFKLKHLSGLLILAVIAPAWFGYSALDLKPAFAATADEQKVAQLRAQIAELEKQAAQYRQGIAQEQAEAKTLKNEIAALERQIKNLEFQISLTDKKIDAVQIEIGGVGDTIYTTQEKIDMQREAVAQILLLVDRRDQESLLSVLLKNENLSDFFKDTEYNADFGNKLLTLLDDLRNQKQELENQKVQLEGKQEELEDLNQQQLSTRSSLGGNRQSKNQLLAQTKGQEAQYQKLLNDVEKKKAQFFNELRAIESAAITGGNFIVHVTAVGLPPKGTKLFRWPETYYRITQGYGMTAYAKRGAYGGAPHNGIDMASGHGSPIMSIGDGTVIANGFNNGFGNWVAVQHIYGLVSIYGHMSAFAPLKVGTPVKAGQVIGYEGTTGNSTGSHLHLSLYRNFFTYLKNGQLYFNYFDGSINPLDYM